MTITINANTINVLIIFLMTTLTGLEKFDWLTLFDADTAKTIIGCIGLLGLFVQAAAVAFSKFTIQPAPPEVKP